MPRPRKEKKHNNGRTHRKAHRGEGDATADPVTNDHYSSTAQSTTPQPISSRRRSRRAIGQQDHEATAGHSCYPPFPRCRLSFSLLPHQQPLLALLFCTFCRTRARDTYLRENGGRTRRSTLLSCNFKQFSFPPFFPSVSDVIAVRAQLHGVFPLLSRRARVPTEFARLHLRALNFRISDDIS